MLRISSVEGNRQWLDGGAMYGNVPRALWATWTPPDERGRIELATRGFLIETSGGKKILLETGIGAFFAPRLAERYGVLEPEHRLLGSLKELGVRPDDIDAVVLSHLHFDHAGGLLSAYSEETPSTLLFPQAEFVVSEVAWSRARKPHVRDRASFIFELNELLEKSGRLRILSRSDAADNPYGPQLSFFLSEGHTPGMLLTQLHGTKATALFCADLVPAEPWVHLPVTMGYDRAPESLIDEKAELFSRSIGNFLLFEHDTATVAGELVASEDGRFSLGRRSTRLIGWDIDEESEPPRPRSSHGI